MDNNQVKVDLTETPWIKCEDGNMMWETSMLFKRISPLLSPSGKEELVPAELVTCKKCGKFITKFNSFNSGYKSDFCSVTC